MSITLADIGWEVLEDFRWSNRVPSGDEPEMTEGPYRESFEWIRGQVNDGRFMDFPELRAREDGAIPFALNPENLKNWKLIETIDQVKAIDANYDLANVFLMDGELDAKGNLVEWPELGRRVERGAWIASMSNGKDKKPNPYFMQYRTIFREKGQWRNESRINRNGKSSLLHNWEDWVGINNERGRLLFIYQEEKIHSLNHSRGFPIRN